MKGTIISIIIGALLGVALTLGSSVHASRAAASRATPVSGVIVELPPKDSRDGRGALLLARGARRHEAHDEHHPV